jgi:hypothetical protein
VSQDEIFALVASVDNAMLEIDVFGGLMVEARNKNK